MRVPPVRFLENRNFLILRKIGLAAERGLPLRTLRRTAVAGKTAIIASELEFRWRIAPTRSGGTVIDVEGESEEKSRGEPILDGEFKHVPLNRRSRRRLVADQPEQSASGQQYEKHHEQELDEHGGKTGQPEESEIRRNKGQNQKRCSPAEHENPAFSLLETFRNRLSSQRVRLRTGSQGLRCWMACEAPRMPAKTTARSGFSWASLASKDRVAASGSACVTWNSAGGET